MDSYKNISVLTIDDDTWMIRVLTKIFGNLGIKKVFSANNGFDGVAIALKERPDVIFLDLMMPELSGLQTLKMLKTLSETSGISVLIVSANSDYLNLGAAISSGAADFVSKPFTADTIKEKLEKVLQKADFFQKTELEESKEAAENKEFE